VIAFRSWPCSPRTKVRSSPAAVTATTSPPGREGRIVATVAPLTVRCTTASGEVSVTKYGGTCPDLTYELTGGPAGTLGRSAAALPIDGPFLVWITVTIVTTTASTASPAATGASRAPGGQSPDRGQHLAVLLADQRHGLG
jgi:hypothetical protein